MAKNEEQRSDAKHVNVEAVAARKLSDAQTLRAVHEFLQGTGLDCMFPSRGLTEQDAERLTAAGLLASMSAQVHFEYAEADEREGAERVGYFLTPAGLRAIAEVSS